MGEVSDVQDRSDVLMKNKEKKEVKVMDVVYIILGCVFALLFMVFLLPVLGYVLNIGNITGMIFCAAMMFLTFGHRYVEKAAGVLRASAAGKALLIAVAAVFALGIVYVGFLTSLIIGADKTAPAQGSTVIVLGCQVRGTYPSLMLRQRIGAAARYLEEHPDAVCIVSGGKGDDEQISEAECMFENLVSLGISPDRIYMEDKSVNTVENIAFSKKIIEEHRLSTDTAIVTDIFHEYRASRIVKNAELGYGSVPAEVSWYLIPTFYVRELIAITATFVGLA